MRPPFRVGVAAGSLIVVFLDSGSVTIEDVVYKWKSKGTGSKVVVSYLMNPQAR